MNEWIVPSGITASEAERLDKLAARPEGFGGPLSAYQEFAGGYCTLYDEQGRLDVPVSQILRRWPTK